ncbi:MAG: hypothetical protein AAF934_12195 [Bacteroidota bacterium]
MKKLILMILLCVFAIGCTAISIEDDEYDNQIEAVDLSKIHRPGDKNKDKNNNGC